MAQWLITALLVVGCFAYAAKMFWPKVLALTRAADKSGGGCGGGCSGCARSATSSATSSAGGSVANSAVTKSCTSHQEAVHEIVFHTPRSQKF